MRFAEILLAWLGYFALHSLFADSSVKGWIGSHWPEFMRGYRVVFNAIATLTLLPVLWLVYDTDSSWLWQWRGAWAWVANGVALMAIPCFFASSRSYDMGEFLGVRQWREHRNDAAQTFAVSFFHRFVRHPWYSTSLALIWSRDMNQPLLVSGLAITAYFVIGSRLEESKLIASYGEKYRNYMAAVPGLIPLPWKYLSAAEATSLMHRPDSH
ncbi:MAG: hypothetical protein NTY41_09270 [Proteobacteria bacterium]|nr:hypothetical protein [Pseudomonadota bacterium]